MDIFNDPSSGSSSNLEKINSLKQHKAPKDTEDIKEKEMIANISKSRLLGEKESNQDLQSLNYKHYSSEKSVQTPEEILKISEFRDIFLDKEVKIDQDIIKNYTIPFSEIEKTVKENETSFDNNFEIKENKENFSKILQSHPEINRDLIHLEKEELSDPIEDLKVIWKELDEVKNATEENKEKGVAKLLSMILGAASLGGGSATIELESLPLSMGPKGEKYFQELEKITEAFSVITLSMTFGSQIIQNMTIILDNFELQRLSDQMSHLQQLILNKNEELKKDPNNQQIKKEIEELEKKYDDIEEQHFNKSLTFGIENIKAPVTALTGACEALTKLLPSLGNSGIQSAVSLLLFLGGAIGMATATAQIHQSKQNIVKIQEIRKQLTLAVEQLEKENISPEVIKMLKMRIQNLGKGRIAMEVSNLVAAIIRWAGTGGSTTQNFLVGTSLVKGALITKVGTILSAGTVLIPAAIGAIAYLRLQRATLWKSFKTSEDRGTIEVANRLLEREGKRYQTFLKHPYYEFTQKVDQWIDQLDQQDLLTQELLSLNGKIMKEMDDKTYKKWKQDPEGDLINYATEEQKRRLTTLRQEIENLRKNTAKFKSKYNSTVNKDSLQCKYVENMEKFRIDKNNEELGQEIVNIKMKILEKQSVIEAKTFELKRGLKNLVRLQRWHSNQVALVEQEYIKKMVSSHTNLTENDVNLLKEEIALMWKDPKAQQEIKDYFTDNHKELYGQLISKPVETLMKWVAGIEL